MAGILDNKMRIMDVVVTEEGRRQMSSGKMKIEFASFTDRHTYYEGDVASGSANASDRLFLEATSLPQDQICYETDNSGNILNFGGGDLELDAEGSVFKASSSGRITKVVSPDVFASITASLLEQTINNFSKQFLVGTWPETDVSSSFGINVDYVSFTTNDLEPAEDPTYTPSIDDLQPMPFNELLQFTRHADYIPPIYKDTAGKKRVFAPPFQMWPDLTSGTQMKSLQDAIKHIYRGSPQLEGNRLAPIEEELDACCGGLGAPGEMVSTANPMKTVSLLGSGTPDMNIACQMFEIAKNDTKMTKLDMMDTGYWTYSPTDAGVASTPFTARIVYVGKNFIDSVGIPSFVKIYTLVFWNSKGISEFDWVQDGGRDELEMKLRSIGHSFDADNIAVKHFNALPGLETPDRSGLRDD